MSRRRMRTLVLAGYLLAGAFVTQFLTMCTTLGTASVNSSGILIDDNGYFLGLFYVCGQQNIQYIDANGNPAGTVQNTQDDLMWGCPAQQIPIPAGQQP